MKEIKKWNRENKGSVEKEKKHKMKGMEKQKGKNERCKRK